MSKNASSHSLPRIQQEWPLLLCVGTAAAFFFLKDALFAYLGEPIGFALLALCHLLLFLAYFMLISD